MYEVRASLLVTLRKTTAAKHTREEHEYLHFAHTQDNCIPCPFVSVFAARNPPFRVGYSATKNRFPVGTLDHPGLLVYPLELLAMFGGTSGGNFVAGERRKPIH